MRSAISILLISISLCMLPCCQKTHKSEFINVVHDHYVITQQTCHNLILSISDRLKEANVTDEERSSLIDLLDRLNYMSQSAEAISEYVNKEIITEKDVVLLLRSEFLYNKISVNK